MSPSQIEEGYWKSYRDFYSWRSIVRSLDAKQIVMVNADEAKRYFGCESAEQARKMNLCWVGDTEALMSGDSARVEKAVKELEAAGWK